MRNIIIAAIAGLSLFACANPKTKPQNTQQETSSESSVSKDKENTVSASSSESEEQNATHVAEPFSVKEIIHAYLTIKNALTKDDRKQATAAAAKRLYEALGNTKTDVLDNEKKYIFTDIYESAKENAETLSSINAGNVEHQREHFMLLSRDINDLIDSFGTDGVKLYQYFCPMYNNKKGAIWISEKKPLETPSFENLSTLTGKYGEEGDRLIFKILNSGNYTDKVNEIDWQNKDTRKLTYQISEKALRYALQYHLHVFVAMNHGQLDFPCKRYSDPTVMACRSPTERKAVDYYTGAIFEVKSKRNKIGVYWRCGRYNNPTEVFGVKNIPGIGFRFGLDRLTGNWKN
ncbi:hypothetical protein FQR65_LT16375 [Abscondita terminalis]|nr:hypothetical protein FQR65_LT16375 [Abscondita terminalis]